MGDFQGHLDSVDTIVASEPEVFAHNVETVRRRTRVVRDVRSSYDQSLTVLRRARATGSERMLTEELHYGWPGESDDEVVETMCDLKNAGVDIVTVGQYLRPTPRHHEVVRFVEPATFESYATIAQEMGFRHAACGPLVRSSHRAAEVFLSSLCGERNATDGGMKVAAADWVKVELAKRLETARREAARVASTTAAMQSGPRQTGGAQH